MKVVAQIRCAHHTGSKPKLAALGFEAGELVVEWRDPARAPLTWDGDQSVTPVRRSHPTLRRESVSSLPTVRLSNGGPVVFESFMLLHCRACGTVQGPRWVELLGCSQARALVTLLAERPSTA